MNLRMKQSAKANQGFRFHNEPMTTDDMIGVANYIAEVHDKLRDLIASFARLDAE